jgi:diguanylate cyclase (GGDEF)-like protein
LVIALGVLLAAAAVVGAVCYVTNSRDEALESEYRYLQNMAVLLAEATERSFASLDIIETNLAARLLEQGARDRDSFSAVAANPALTDVLASSIENLPHVEKIGVFDARGWLVASSVRGRVLPADLSAQEEVAEIFGETAADIIITRPVHTRGDSAWSVFVAKRVRAENGQVLGAVVAALSLGYLDEFYKRIALSEGTAITLSRADGLLITRFPQLTGLIGRAVATGAARTPVSPLPVSQLRPQVKLGLDGIERLAAFRRLPRYPIVTAVSRTTDEVLLHWKQESKRVGFLALFAVAFIGASCALIVQQIREGERAAESARRFARRDNLTGVPNRLHFREALDAAFEAPLGFSLLLVDLDGFKDVNDSFGHQAGDELLQGVAARLTECLGAKDSLARLGGDEFAVIHPHTPVCRPASELARLLVRAAEGAFERSGVRISGGASVGVALAREHGRDEHELMRNVDLALYEAKAAGGNCFRIFEQPMAVRFARRKQMTADLRVATERNEFELFYQPIARLGSNEIVGFEALLRWRHPARGLVSPADFIPLAEETGLIGEIGAWALRTACLEAVEWPSTIRLAVNVSPVQFKLRDLLRDIEFALAASGLSPDRLELEVTESLAIEESAANRTILESIRALGVKISLDDFGTGYSSLSYLKSFRFDTLKIDRSFVTDIETETDCEAIVDAALTLAKRLGMSVVAEGVETVEQLRALTAKGCPEAQGYLIARPMPSDDIENFLKATPLLGARAA